MTVAKRIESLNSRRAALKAQAHTEESRPCPNEGLLFRLKQDNLRMKDEILRLSLHAGEGAVRAATG